VIYARSVVSLTLATGPSNPRLRRVCLWTRYIRLHRRADPRSRSRL